MLEMKERRGLVEVIAEQYRKVDKSEEGRILDWFLKATNYHRHYAARLLRYQGRQVKKPTVPSSRLSRARPEISPRPGAGIWRRATPLRRS